jgi:membrane protein required for colicin V production
MIIDITFAIILIMAIFKGLSKGFIIGIFSFVAFTIGLAAALKLSAVVAGWLENKVTGFTRWLPFISFVLVFIAVILLVNLLARLIKKTFAMLGWLDKIGGLVLYVVIYTIIFSIFLFFAEKVNLVSQETIAGSTTYSYVSPWGPKVIDNLGKIIPLFKDMFSQLQDFFGGIIKK